MREILLRVPYFTYYVAENVKRICAIREINMM